MSAGDTASRSDLQRPCSPRATPTGLPLAPAARRPPLLDPGRGAPRGAARAAVDRLTELDPARLRRVQRVGTLSGFAAGARAGPGQGPPHVGTRRSPPAAISILLEGGVLLWPRGLHGLGRGAAV